MSSDRKKVLELLAERKISADDAERLLERLGSEDESGPLESKGSASAPRRAPRFMCIHVDSADGDQVNVRLPIVLVQSGIKLSALVPKSAVEAVQKNGVDLSELSHLDGDALMDALAEMTVDVQSQEGDTVRIYCE